ARGVAKLRGDLRHRLREARAIAAVAEALLVLQHGERDGDRRERQQQEHAAEEETETKAREPGPLPGLQSLTQVHAQRKPRMGTLSMPSKLGSMSRKASRMVLTCLRTLS